MSRPSCVLPAAVAAARSSSHGSHPVPLSSVAAQDMFPLFSVAQELPLGCLELRIFWLDYFVQPKAISL